MNFIKEKKIYCGDYLEVDIIPRSRNEKMPEGKRNKKKKLSAPKQKRLNDKNSRRYLIQIINTNFSKGDLHITATYSEEELPSTIEEAENEVRNYLRRIAYRRKKEGLPPLKYILVTEHSMKKEKPIRIHHHIIVNGGLDREIIESLWSRRRRKGEKEGKAIGYVNADRLQPDNFGFEALGRYLMKGQKGKKKWSGSQNLDKPVMSPNDHKYTKRKVERLVKNIDDREYWEKQYKGYWLTEAKAVYNDLTGWSIYLKMRKGDGD